MTRSFPKLASLSMTLVMTLAFVATAVLTPRDAAAAPIKVYGVEMPSWSKKVAEDRYQSPRGWAKTVKHFQDEFRGWRGVKWTTEVNLPSVKYVHVENTNKKADWAGINIYAGPNGKVRIFVLKRDKTEPKKTEPKKTEPKKTDPKKTDK